MYNVLLNFRCRGVTRIPIYSPKRFQYLIRNSTTYGGSGGGGGRGVIYTIGGLALVGGGTLAYARYDPSFNKWVRENVPYSEVVLDNVFKDNYSDMVLDKIKDVTQVVKEKTADITQSLGIGEKSKKTEDQLPKKVQEVAPVKVTPIKIEEVVKKPVTVPSKVPEKPTPESTSIVKSTLLPDAKKSQPEKQEPIITESKTTSALPGNLSQMQSEIVAASKEALAAYEEAVKLLQSHTQKVYCAIENSIDKWDESIWTSLKEKINIRDEAIKKAEEKSNLAREKIDALRDSLVGVVGNTATNARAEAVKNLSSLDKAGLDFKNELFRASLTEQYRERVESARKHFQTEFSTLLPSLRVGEKNKHVTADEFDLFVYHVFKKLHYYQKELAKLETLGRDALSKALLQRGEDITSDLNKAFIQEELDHQRRKLEAEYQNAETKLRDLLCKECKDELRRAADTNARHLADAVTARTLELERRYKRDLDEKVSSEKMKHKTEVASVLGRLRGIEAAMKARTDDDEVAHKSMLLWTACQSLLRAIKAGPPSSLPWEERLQPLQSEIAAVGAAAPSEDELVSIVVSGIPDVARSRGVFPEDALRERFLKVEKVARSVALVGEEGASLPVYFLSYIQSLLLARGVGGLIGGGGALYGIPDEELADSPIDIKNLDTYDVLDRARYWLDRGDFLQALKYMNLLEGAPRVVARDWIDETRIMLATKYAADTLSAHAFASSGHHVCPPK